ncbi:MAG TPA: hypothetical protein LFW13_02650 [Rickettsia endosymbiont of Sericostoma sp.]|jgi:hypothetical protein|uniref:hypothetical protein n=1 Tax=Candidatus Tisiphia endosymbiont of Nemotelus uliginosus TaxID=3077926 RepID=UPI001D563553|nr:hypothetical protein [Rickettsia endosymbiont of Sericostoma sp.]
MKKDFTAIYCFVDDFIKSLSNNFPAINSSIARPGISNYLSTSEVLTILLGYYDSCYDCFKHYYKRQLCTTIKKILSLLVTNILPN